MKLTRRTAFKTLAATSAVFMSAAKGVFAQDGAAVVEMSMGPDDAAVTVIEYASFTCPHCASFHKDVFHDLKSEFIDTGKIRFVFREVYFDRFGLWAGMIARCGGEQKYFGIVDMLFKRQREWAVGGEDPSVIVDNIKKIGRIAGLSDAEMEECLMDKDHAKALVEEFQKNATADNIDSTPSFIIDGEKYSNMSFAEMSKLLNEKLEG